MSRRNATLLFQSRPLEERELVHVVNESYQRAGGPCELTFHICATLNDPAMGQQLMQTVMMIHRLYDCPSYIYGLVPDLEKCSNDERNSAWKCLTAINNGINDYPHLRLVSQCFLYNDASQKSLARFLYRITSEPEALDTVERYGYMSKLVTQRKNGDMSFVPEFPKVFATFNATGISYPEEEVRYYLHQSYLHEMLELSRSQSNPIDMEQCNGIIDNLLQQFPLQHDKVTLSAPEFLEVPQEKKKGNWEEMHQYWENALTHATKELDDRPHDEWFNLLRRTCDVNYQTRFRDKGVEFFYDQQRKLTAVYCEVLLEGIRQHLQAVMHDTAYPQDGYQVMVRTLVNRLQLLAMSLGKELEDGKQSLTELNKQAATLTKEWESMGFFDRMRGKDKELLGAFTKVLVSIYQTRTALLGAEFGAKLLNELIPQISALPDQYAHLMTICQQAYDITQQYLDNNDPHEFINACFTPQLVLDAVATIRANRNDMQEVYIKHIQHLFYTEHSSREELSPVVTDGDMLLQELRETMAAEIDDFLSYRVAEGTMPPVLKVDVLARLAQVYADKGGLPTLVDEMKQKTALTLKTKGKGGQNEQYLLIAPVCDELGLSSYIQSKDESSVHLLHFLTGISLTDLDGFSGQRMFVEPSMF